MILPTCGCADPSVQVSLFDDANTLICTNKTQLNCIQNVRSSNVMRDYCEKYCPLECDSVSYDFKANFADYPTQYYYNVTIQQTNLKSKLDAFAQKKITNVNFDSFKSSSLAISVYLRDLKYKLVNETPAVSADTLFGVIGKFSLLYFISIV